MTTTTIRRAALATLVAGTLATAGAGAASAHIYNPARACGQDTVHQYGPGHTTNGWHNPSGHHVANSSPYDRGQAAHADQNCH